jgi:hypothetical protein
MSTGPRPQGPKRHDPQKRPTGKLPGAEGGGSGRNLWLAIGAVGLVALAAVAGYLVFAGGSSAAADAPRLLRASGCEFQSVKALKSNDHSIPTPGGTSASWNTSPPTSGPHYGVATLWGAYKEPVNQGQLVHNLEHGGVFIQYGKDVPQATVQELERFYDRHTNATVLAPLPSLGDEIALGVWTTPSPSEPDDGTAYLARCTTFDDEAYSAFFAAFQGRGPERFPMVSLVPGS